MLFRSVIYVTARIEIQCEDMSLEPNELFEDMDYNFELNTAGAEVIDTELVEYEVAKD